MFRSLIGLTLLISTPCWAQTVTDVKCMTAGDRPTVAFEGKMVVSTLVDLPNGGFTVHGRRIAVEVSENQGMEGQCRSWFLDVEDAYLSGRRVNSYVRKSREWNVMNLTTQNATLRMTCAVGSVLREFDTVEDYVQEFRSQKVEATAPRPGTLISQVGYISGSNTVSAPECIFNSL